VWRCYINVACLSVYTYIVLLLQFTRLKAYH
jgi:hypothetical protein